MKGNRPDVAAGCSLLSPFLRANRLLYYWGEVVVFEGRAVLCLNYVERVGQKSALGETVLVLKSTDR